MSELVQWWSGLLNYLLKMGCLLLKPALQVEGVRYRVKKQLAEGGFSTVDLAESSETGRLVALKRITCHSIEDQNAANFEIKVHQSFNHPNIIKLIGSSLQGEADIVHNRTSEVVMVLPYYPRGTLQHELEMREGRKEQLEERVVLRIFLSICQAVREFHEHDPVLAHRDIKPHNILLEKDFTPVVMDLGSAANARVQVRSHRDAQFLQDTAAERCSMTYRAPELFQVPSHCDIDEKTDIWSLGCLLYALMYFKSPFDSVYERGDSVALAVQSGSISFPEKGSQMVFSSQLQDLVLRMLNLDWTFRPSIGNVIEQVEEILGQGGQTDHVVQIQA